MTSVFVPAVGQFDNIGDIILRRPHLAMLRPHGRLHVYLGDHPDGYAAGLLLDSEDLVYRSFGSWYRALLSTAAHERVHYAFKPGEIQLSFRGMKEHVAMVPALRAVHRGGGKVLRIGAGARTLAPLPRAIMRPSLQMTDLSVWRDGETAAYLGGDTMPDLGFATGSEATPAGRRDLLAVSLRGDRPHPGTDWLSGLRMLALELQATPFVVTQVARDSPRSIEIAALLGAPLLDFSGLDHDAQEESLRVVYRNSRAVVSDRLHVLVAAATEGARLLAPALVAGGKIPRHLSAAGFPTVDWVAHAQKPVDFVHSALDRFGAQSDSDRTLSEARNRIREVSASVDQLLRKPAETGR